MLEYDHRTLAYSLVIQGFKTYEDKDHVLSK